VSSDAVRPDISFVLNGDPVRVADGITLLDALREELGCRSVKDGCSPQGQCGCCTVWVDDAPRVSCVTPVRRVAGRRVTTLEGLSPEQRDRWSGAFVRAGASQCGFCTPGILMRLAALEGGEATGSRAVAGRDEIEAALRAHLCRCTGWQSIVEAALSALGGEGSTDRATLQSLREDQAPTQGPMRAPTDIDPTRRDPVLASWRAQLEGTSPQASNAEAVLGHAGFADDTSPPDALVQLGADTAPAESIRAARAGLGRIQGRNSTVPLTHPVELPSGSWALTLQTTWSEPAYVEPDASWCVFGDAPATPLANGGAFGGKRSSAVAEEARRLAERTGRPARVLWRREDVVRRGPKRPPLAIALRDDGSGVVRLGRSAGSPDLSGLVAHLRALAPSVEVEEVPVIGPTVSPDLRGAGWAEVLAALAALRAPAATASGRASVSIPGGGRATVDVELGEGERGRIVVDVWAGRVLCPVTLRSYVLGAVHQALGLVWSEGIAVDDAGEPVDLTIRSFGILAARDVPDVSVHVHEEARWPVNGSDAVFAATLAAAWVAEGRPARWPTRREAMRSPRRDVTPLRLREEATP
jgi:aerobic-type carbon monoxide dehydrogenase small subunit (CoxS/CutS family)